MSKYRFFSFQDTSYIILFLLLITYMVTSVQVSAQPEYEHILEVEVNAGDTLWSIASKYGESMPIAAYISLLKVENNLKDHYIYPGQILLVPQLTSKEVIVVADESNHLLSSKY